ncbi:hypothetical protein L1887_59350 [Cichorium endivia]|nr:hypothetical protein L1887_59350 [Cichorium endivia]
MWGSVSRHASPRLFGPDHRQSIKIRSGRAEQEHIWASVRARSHGGPGLAATFRGAWSGLLVATSTSGPFFRGIGDRTDQGGACGDPCTQTIT